MPVQPFDNTNLINMCRDCGAIGFVPALAYTYNAGSGDVVVTNSSTIPAGDTLLKIKVRLVDQFGGEVRGHIDGSAGGEGYTSPPAVSFVGGTGSGATGTSTIANGKVTGVTITAPGSYTVAPNVVFTGGGGSGAAGTANLTGTALTSVTMTADDNAVTLSAATLNTSKDISIIATILTANQIAADGSAFYIGAAGTLNSWDVQKNA